MSQPYVITKVTLSEKEFWDLMFFYPHSHNPKDRFEFDKEWCGMKVSEVVDDVFNKNLGIPHTNPGEILHNIMPEADRHHDVRTWFKLLVQLGRKFEYGKMPKILIRNVKPGGEKNRNPGCSFRIEDGNHRAIVFGLWLKINDFKYEEFPMIAIHSNSFYCAFEADRMIEILGFGGQKNVWEPWKPNVLENNGILNTEQTPDFCGNDPNHACDAIYCLKMSDKHMRELA